MLESILKALGLLAEPEQETTEKIEKVEKVENVEKVERVQLDAVDSTWLRHWHDEALLSINHVGRSCIDAVTPSGGSGEMDAPLAAMWAVALVFAAAVFVALLRRCRTLLRGARPKRRRATAEEEDPAPSSSSSSSSNSVPAATSEERAAEQQNGSAAATPSDPPLVRDEGLWPAEGPVQQGQLPRQCDCFLEANYFVDRVCGGKEINVHFEYNGERTTFLEKYGRMYPANVAEAIFHELERQRGLRLTAESRTLERKRAIAEAYEPQYPAVRQLLPSYLDPDFLYLAALAQEARTSEEALHRLRQAVQPLSPATPGVFEMPVLDPNFCAQLVSELAHIREEMDDTLLERPNSMNHFGVLLDEFGFTPGFTNVLVAEYIRPLAAALLGPEYASLDNHRYGRRRKARRRAFKIRMPT
jgi:hypothetical protein